MEIDEPVRFEVMNSLVGLTDRPVTGQNVPLWSRRVADPLQSLGGFDSRSYEALLVDANGKPMPTTAHDFVLFHLRTVIDALDPERSVYQRYPPSAGRAAGRISVVETLVLRTSGLPPCFFVQGALQFGMLLSEAGRNAVESLPALGIGFEVVETVEEPPAMT